MRVLAVIELGGQWGHLLRIKPVLDALRRRGHLGTLATTDVASARHLFEGERVEIVACPSLRLIQPAPRATRYRHYAQLLDACAFGDDAALAANVRHWMVLLDRLKPDVMLTDFAPLALFVAHLKGIPVVQISTGWEAPKHGEPLPTISVAEDEDDAGQPRFEARMLDRLNRRCHDYGAAPLRRVSDLYATGTQLLACWPETDHFSPRATARYIGPIYSERHGAPVAWPQAEPSRPRVFVYLAPGPHDVKVLEALRDAGADVIAVLPGLPPAVADSVRGSRLQILDGPVRTGDALLQARLTVSNGGHGLVGASLSRGVPLLIVPRTAEQFIQARRLAGQGLAHVLGAVSPSEVRATVMRALHDEDSLARAAAVAARHAGQSLSQTLRDVTQAVELTGASAQGSV